MAKDFPKRKIKRKNKEEYRKSRRSIDWYSDYFNLEWRKRPQRRSGKIVFVRVQGYMEKAMTHTEMGFCNHSGEVINIVHAWAVLKSALIPFLKRLGDEGFIPEQISVNKEAPQGFIYALDWDEVNDFVSGSHEASPPRLRKYRRRHAVGMDWDERVSWSGASGGWELTAYISYQIVVSPVKLAYIKGMRKE